MKTIFGWLLACLVGGLMIGNQATAQDALYELRVYTPEEGRQADLLKLMENTGIKFLSKHKIELVGAWVANDASDSRVVTLVRHADRKPATPLGPHSVPIRIGKPLMKRLRSTERNRPSP
ncbi:MAG: NIPSNAP family protein [Pirellula sp.]